MEVLAAQCMSRNDDFTDQTTEIQSEPQLTIGVVEANLSKESSRDRTA